MITFKQFTRLLEADDSDDLDDMMGTIISSNKRHLKQFKDYSVDTIRDAMESVGKRFGLIVHGMKTTNDETPHSTKQREIFMIAYLDDKDLERYVVKDGDQIDYVMTHNQQREAVEHAIKEMIDHLRTILQVAYGHGVKISRPVYQPANKMLGDSKQGMVGFFHITQDK